MIETLLAAAILATPAAAQELDKRSPNEIVAAAPASEWVAIAPQELLVMTLAPDRDGKPREVVIQLMPPPFSQGWVENIRTLARARWYDGLSINRVQDNYVVQWGDPDGEDAAKTKKLPAAVYAVEGACALNVPAGKELKMRELGKELAGLFDKLDLSKPSPALAQMNTDAYLGLTLHHNGWPFSVSGRSNDAAPVHCYGMVGVGRGMPPDTGSGAELYTVIGHAPRHLDRNIALVGRVVEGIEHLSSLPRGTEALGFYKTPQERVPIRSIRLASDLPAAEQPRFQYLSTESGTFAAYAEARANRRDPFFIHPAGGADICNIPVPVRRVGE
jgi:peptidylprolyl isomerase